MYMSSRPKEKHTHFTVLGPISTNMNVTGLHTSQNMISFLLGFVSMHGHCREPATKARPAENPCDLW